MLKSPIRTIATATAKKWTTAVKAPYKSKATIQAELLKQATLAATVTPTVITPSPTIEAMDEDLIDIEHLIPKSNSSPSNPYEPTQTTAEPILQSKPIQSDYPSIPFPIQSDLIPTPIQSTVAIDWSTSFHGLSSQPFSKVAAQILMRELSVPEIEIKPDGLLYLPEILYRRKLNEAFGPGGWGMVPRGEMTVTKMMVSREWGLIAGGRLVSIARGEQTFFDPSGLPTATEGCKSNALMRCCKDLGIASELWDPAFIRVFKGNHCVEAWTEHVVSKKKLRRWRKKGNKFEYPLKEASSN